MGRKARTPTDKVAALAIGQRIRSARLAIKPAKMTQRQLGELCGVTEQTVCDWEKGRATPSATKLALLAEVLRSSPGFVIPSKLPEKDSLELRAAELATKVGPRLIERMLEVPTHPLRAAIGRAIEDYHARIEESETQEKSS